MDAYQVPAKLSGLRPDHGPFNPDDGIYIQFDEDLKMTSVRGWCCQSRFLVTELTMYSPTTEAVME